MEIESPAVEKMEQEAEVDQVDDAGQNGATVEDQKQERKDFTSENNKIEITNLGKFAFGELRNLIKKFKLRPTKIKTKNNHGGKDHAFLCFRTVEEKEAATKLFDGYIWKGRALKVNEAKPTMDPLARKRLIEEAIESGGELPKKMKRFYQKTVLEATAPFAHLPYAEQIKRKESECIRHLMSYASGVKKASLELRPIIQENVKKLGLPCIWHGIKESPHINGYRNKNEFNIGKNDNGEITVGFRLGSYSDGSIEIGSIQDVPHVPDRTKQAVRLFEAYIKSSKYSVFSVEHYTGQFRQLTVRLSESTGEIMLVVGIHTSEIRDEIDDLIKDIIAYFIEREGKELNVTSIYLEEMNKREVGQTHNNMRHVYGSKYITDSILGLKFRISAASFFQINTKSAEVLYDLAIKMGKVDSNTSVLDICCGIGTIGLSFAKHCKEVLGVEIIEDAIEDAKFNAKENNIENSKFYAGNCDDYIHSFVYQANNPNLLAVLDPPRAGIPSKSKEALRNAKGLNRFIYIACAPKACMQNWIDFSRPCSKSLKGDPFVLKEAAAVDMFPHTDHVEMVLLFERLTSTPKNKDKQTAVAQAEPEKQTEAVTPTAPAIRTESVIQVAPGKETASQTQSVVEKQVETENPTEPDQ